MVIKYNSRRSLEEARDDYFKKYLDSSHYTLEIAPYFNPTVTKVKGKVWYTDYIDNNEIKLKASRNPHLNGRIPPAIDFVWKPGSHLAQCAPRTNFDVVVASHVLEHVPNPIGWLNELLSVLKVGGSVLLILPDKRLTSDFYRNESSFSDVVDFALENSPVPTTRQILDFMTRSIEDFGGFGTRPYENGVPFEKAKRPWDDAEAVKTAIWAKTTNGYIDVHATVWSPASFFDVFNKVVEVGLINARIDLPIENVNEFMIRFVKLGDPLQVLPTISATTFSIADKVNASAEVEKNFDHQLNIIRHDLAFSIQQANKANAKTETEKNFEHQLNIIRHDLAYSIKQNEVMRKELLLNKTKRWVRYFYLQFKNLLN